MISQSTAEGSSPAMRARSTEASVWPARLSTPPAAARSGNMWPGRARSRGRVSGSMAALTVAARSARGDARRHPSAGLDGDREGGAEVGGVLVHHHRKLELIAPLLGQREADQAPALPGHEVDRLGRHLLRGHDEVPLVLAVLVVHDDDEAPLPELLDRRLDRRKTDFRSWASVSRLTAQRSRLNKPPAPRTSRRPPA